MFFIWAKKRAFFLFCNVLFKLVESRTEFFFYQSTHRVLIVDDLDSPMMIAVNKKKINKKKPRAQCCA